MKKLIAILLLCIPAFGTTSFTGHIGTLGTTSVTTGSFVRFWLRGCGGNQPRVGGLTVIAPSQGAVFFFDFKANSSGNVSGTLYSNRDVTGLTDGEIECGGSHTSTWYGMQIFYAGKGGPEIPILAKSTDTFDVSNITPLTTAPVVTAPDGDSTYARLDGGNQPFTGSVTPSGNGVLNLGGTSNRWNGFFNTLDVSGAATFGGTNTHTGAETFKYLNAIRFASQFTGADCGAKINAADADLGATEGEIWVDQACGLAWTTAVSLSANHVLRFVQCGTYTTTHTITIGNAAGIVGSAPQAMTAGACVIKAANGAALATLVSMPGNLSFIQDVALDGNQANGGTTGTANLILGSGSGGRREINRVTVKNSSGNGLKLTGSCCDKISKLMAITNVADGLFLSSQGDVFVADSEFEQNGASGVELLDSSAFRLNHSDIGGNGASGGKGIKMAGTSAGFHSNNNVIYGNNFGNNYQEDIYIAGYDTVGGAASAVQQTITNNQFVGSPNRPDATYPQISVIDGNLNQIVGNYFNGSGGVHRATYGISFTETSAGRATQSTVNGNAFNSNYSGGSRLDSVQTLDVFRGNTEPGGYFLDSQSALAANYNSGSAKTVAAGHVSGAVFKVSGVEAITQAASSTSTLPSLTLGWTDVGGVARTQTLVSTSATNTTAVITQFTTVIHCNATSVTLTSASYASSGGTPMQYSLAYTVERLQ